jgi:hypothetical protein
MGMDTGYSEQECFNELQNECRGGCEHTIEKPYRILKNPEFALEMEDIVNDYEIDHVIIPIRDLMPSAQSRANNNDNHGRYGGFWLGANSVDEQANAHARLVYHLIEVLTRHDISYTTIAFPRMVTDNDYLMRKLMTANLYSSDFYECFDRVVDLEKVTL